MRVIPKKNTIRKGKLLYRRIRYRRGYGIHSPFAYNLITKVIDERCPYYRYYDIELLRKQLLFKEEVITLPDKNQKNKIHYYNIGEVVKKVAIHPKHGALLFRLTNYFQSRNILQIGSSVGLSTLYLTSYKPGLRCISLENISEYASISEWVYSKGARTSIDLRIGNYRQLLPGILKELGTIDFVFFNAESEHNADIWLFNQCIEYISENAVFVFDKIRVNRRMKVLWREICSHPEVTVTMDLFSMGIVFFNKKLHKRDYIVYF